MPLFRIVSGAISSELALPFLLFFLRIRVSTNIMQLNLNSISLTHVRTHVRTFTFGLS